ncbi:hypothetical protein LTS10_009771 [Elasticomyces elasticus]|nr:hypothetical protein LTS10_009771 [Elasticomyces elasticus]
MATRPPSSTSVKQHLGNLTNFLHRISIENYDGKDFIPHTTFSKHVSEEVVGRCLTDSTKHLARSISSHCKIIFATLALSAKYREFHTTLQELIALDITDADLPIDIREEKGEYFAWTVVAGDPDKTATCLGSIFRGWRWENIKKFFNQQWMFLAPVFSSDSSRFAHYLHCRQPLPFTELGDVSGDGHFGDVRKVLLHPEHQEGFTWWNAGTHPQFWIALKEYKISDGIEMAKSAWDGETKVCEKMRNVTHDHLVERIAAVAQADRYYLLLAWADGGDLRSFWRDNRTPTVTGEQLQEILEQFSGLANAISEMHKDKRSNSMSPMPKSTTMTDSTDTTDTTGSIPAFAPGVALAEGQPDQKGTSHWRHGDLKSENILRCTLAGSWLGTLKMADLGLAKSHDQVTGHRRLPSSTVNATTQYEAPEARTHPLAPWSRRYDIWSLGCILLETVIWFLYGYDELEHFWDTRIDTSKGTLYYTTTSTGTGTMGEVSVTASSWMKHILEHDPECNGQEGTALGDLLKLVQQRLLVVAISNNPENAHLERIDAAALCKALQEIMRKAKAGTGYLCTGTKRVNITPPSESALVNHSANSLGLNLPVPDNSLVPDKSSKRLKLDHPRQDETTLQGVSLHAARFQQRPTRLIDVQTPCGNQLQLVETSSLPSQTADESRYIALSYAWGDENHKRFLATVANYEELKLGILTTDLPKTFQDAVQVTRGLGVRYLWIDALCILQGLGGDFDTEAERMEVVFSNAYCVIAASRATGTSDGFLGERDKQRVVSIPRLGGTHIYVFEPIDDFKQDVIDGHLNKRGWVLQERALARRTIYFAGSQTYWQCGQGVRCETMSRLENKEAAFLGDPNFPKVAEDGSKGAQIHLFELLYRTYSTLAFKNAVDRPVGIAGLESRLVRAYETDGGFGIFEKFLHRGILWRRTSVPVRKIHFSRMADEVPSWSWMAYEGPITFMAIPFDSADWDFKDVHSPWTLQPASAVSRHSARTRSNVCLVVVPRMFRYPRGASSDECLVFDQGNVDPGPEIRCVVIGRQRQHSGSFGARRHYVLLIRPRPRSELYERVGVGYLSGSSITFGGPGRLVQVS